jgi:hypothetical protein
MSTPPSDFKAVETTQPCPAPEENLTNKTGSRESPKLGFRLRLPAEPYTQKTDRHLLGSHGASMLISVQYQDSALVYAHGAGCVDRVGAISPGTEPQDRLIVRVSGSRTPRWRHSVMVSAQMQSTCLSRDCSVNGYLDDERSPQVASVDSQQL